MNLSYLTNTHTIGMLIFSISRNVKVVKQYFSTKRDKKRKIRKGYTMEKEIVREILEKCNWWEKIVVKLFARLFIKVYNIARVKTVNKNLEK